MKKTIFILYCLTLGFIGCHKKTSSPTKKSLVISYAYDPGRFDSRTKADLHAQSFQKILFEGLLRFDRNGQIEPAVAKSYDISDDRLEYTFYLRDCRWSNGDPLTAQDFATNWKTLLSPDFITTFAYPLYPIKNAKAAKQRLCTLEEIGIEVIDHKTLKVTLENPTLYFPELVCNSTYGPGHLKNESFFQRKKGAQLISNGPFSIVKYTDQKDILLQKNNHYWEQNKVNIDQISFEFNPNEDTAFALFEQGTVDYLGYPYGPLPRELSQVDKASLLQYNKSPFFRFCVFNTTVPPLDNTNFRRALSLAIDRPGILRSQGYPGEVPAMDIFPLASNRPEPLFDYYDPQGAKKYLEKALEELNLKKLPSLTLSCTRGSKSFAEILQQFWWENLGIDIKLHVIDSSLILDKLHEGSHQIAIIGWISPISDPIFNLQVHKYKREPINWSRWENSQYIELLDAAEKELDTDKRLKLLYQAHELLISEMPIAPIFHETTKFITNKRLKNYYHTLHGIPIFNQAYIEK